MSTISFARSVAADPELHFTPNGHAVARFTVMENHRRRTEDGQDQRETEENR